MMAQPRIGGLIIDPEFEKQIPPLAPEEFAALEESIRNEGMRERLTVWESPTGHILLDGHNRLKICEKYDIFPAIRKKQFDSREEAADWIDRNQLGRRNLSPEAFAELIRRRFQRMSAGRGGDRRSTSQNETLNGDAAEQIAKEHGISRATVYRHVEHGDNLETLKEIDPDIVEKNRSGQGPTRKQAAAAADAVKAGDTAKAKQVLEMTPEQLAKKTADMKEKMRKEYEAKQAEKLAADPPGLRAARLMEVCSFTESLRLCLDQVPDEYKLDCITQGIKVLREKSIEMQRVKE